MEFPQYRKYTGIDIWFKIINQSHFEEIKKVGEQLVFEDVRAIQYPEKLRIEDMLACHEGRWEILDAGIYESLKARMQL